MDTSHGRQQKPTLTPAPLPLMRERGALPGPDLPASPHRPYAKAGKSGVARNQRHPFEFALRGQHAVEGVTVVDFQRTCAQRVQARHRQMLEGVKRGQFVKTGHRLGGRFQFAKTILGRDFPGARCADQNGVVLVLDEGASRR